MANSRKQQKEEENNSKQPQIPAETRAMAPVDGQILGDINEALNAVVDLKGEKIDFKRNEDVKDDLVYTGEGSDGKTYSLQLQKKSVLVSVYETPKPEEVGKQNKGKKSASSESKSKPAAAKEEGEKKQDLDEIVEKLDKPLLDNEDKKL